MHGLSRGLDGLSARARNWLVDWAMITIDPGEPGPLYLQIATRLRSAIAIGALSAGARLPSARTLSAQLGVARGTVDAAYDLLAGEGAIEPRGAAGTVISTQVNGRAAIPAQRALGLSRPRSAIA